MKLQKLYFLVLLLSVTYIGSSFATTFPTTTQPFSKYGQIQNVQNYSSNPFWYPDAPYNQRLPVPVYLQGTDVDTSDCQRIVNSLITSYCSAKNNCLDISLEDIRPTITVQLASLPNHNFVTPCSGYIETEFENYKKNNTIAAPTGSPVAFPTATSPSINSQEQKGNVEFQNPYAPTLPEWNGEPWMQEMLERKQELKQLQSQNSTSTSQLMKTDFPKTFADLSFSQRQQILKEGYEPYKGTSAYKTIEIIESEESYNQRQTAYCTQELTKLNIINSDIETLKVCQKEGTPISDCISKLKGQYL